MAHRMHATKQLGLLSLVTLVTFVACGDFGVDPGASGSSDGGVEAAMESGSTDTLRDGGDASDGPTLDSSAGVDANGEPEPVKVIQTNTTLSTGNDVIAAFDAPMQSRSLIVVAIANKQPGGTLVVKSVNDGKGNFYSDANAPASAPESCGCSSALWTAKLVNAGATAVTVSVNGGTTQVWIFEVAGLGAPFGVGSGTVGTGPVIRGITVAVDKPGSLVVSTACACAPITGSLETTNFTYVSASGGGGAGYFVTPAAGTYGGSWKSDATDAWTVSNVALRP